MNRLPLALLAVCLITSCSDEAPSDKGSEESPLTDGKEDSFFRPTEHGTLQFGIPNRASFTDDEQFHAWTFSLSDEATLSLRTDISDNLDTVMYLYHRDDPADSWGRFEKKNDDHEENLWSQIDVQGRPGEYRVLVKGFKLAVRGGFSVVGSCDGPGCSSSGDMCESGEFGDMPRTTRYTDSCTSRITEVLASPVESENSGSVRASEHCTTSGIVRTSLEQYVGFWEDVVGISIDDIFFDTIEETDFEFDVQARGEGHVVFVNAGGDEDGVEFIYDKEGNLLSAFQHNQSPTVEFFCAQAGDEPEADTPFAECFSDIMRNYPSEDADAPTQDSGRETLDDIEAVDFFGVAEAVADYREIFPEVDDLQLVEYSVDEFAVVTQVNLFTVADDSTSLWANYTFINDGIPIMIRQSWDSLVVCE